MSANGKTIVQGYVLSNNTPSQSIADGYYFKLTNAGLTTVQVQFSSTGALISLAAGASYEFAAGNPFFPFAKQERLTVSGTGAFIVNLIVAYVKYE